mgnify:CR=1 FL=1
MSNDGTFRPIGESEERMFGPTKLIVSGYDKAQKEEFLSLLSAIGLGELGVVFATDGDGETPLLQLASRPHKSGFDSRSTFPRAIVMSGLTENELHAVMGGWRTLQMPRQLWAALTPHSQNWGLLALLSELAEEAKAMAEAKGKPQ